MKIKGKGSLFFAASIIVTILLAFFGRPLLNFFQVSYNSIEDSLGGYVASMLGAVVGTFLAISSASWLEEDKEKKQTLKTGKMYASVLLGDISSLIGRIKSESIWAVACKDERFELWGQQAAETLKEDSYYSFLTEEKRIEYVSELVKISESNHSFSVDDANKLLYFYEASGKKVNREFCKIKSRR